jgi:glycosyltransferase involved in cell wall biosynthesis
MAGWDWRKSYARKWLFFHLYLKRVWRRAGAIRFLSEQEASGSAVKWASRCSVIPNWVNSSAPVAKWHVLELRRQLEISEDAPIILFLGRMTEQKGVAEIVAAFDRLARRRPDSVLVLVGPRDEAYGTKLEQIIARLPSCKSIRVLGPIFDDRRFSLLSTASVFITLSKNEGLPLAVLEALASGLPVVVTQAANLPEIVRYGAGAVVGQEPGRVAAALLTIIENHARRRTMGEQARKLVAECFSPEVVLPRLQAFYQSLVSQEMLS